MIRAIIILIVAAALTPFAFWAWGAWGGTANPPLAVTPAPVSRIDKSGDPLLHLPHRTLLEEPKGVALPKPVRPVVRYVQRKRPLIQPAQLKAPEEPIVRVTTVEPAVELPLYPER